MNKLFISKYDYYISKFFKFLYRNAPPLKLLHHFIWTFPSSIYGCCKLKLSKKKPLKIVIGSSWRFSKGWIPTDISFFNIVHENHWERYFKNKSVSALLAEHVWEHLTTEEADRAAKLCYNYLQPDGYIRIAVPDGFHPDKEYIEYVRPNGVGPESEDHKTLYNYKSIGEVFKRHGFKVKYYEYYDENHNLYQLPWKDEDGIIMRSGKHDKRNMNGKIIYTSIIFDAFK